MLRPLFCIVMISLYTCNVQAESLGDLANTIYEPVSIVIQLVRAVSIICGAGLLLGGILKFVDYRRNPMQVRSSTVVFMFIFGLSLILVGLIPLQQS